jgi:diacylglycerol kinase (ATP)
MSGVVFVVNPRSGGGATGRKLEALRGLAADHFTDAQFVLTDAQGHATVLAERAARGGAHLVVAVGGDGTASEVVNGLMRLERGRPVFAVLPCGTGSDLVKTLRMPPDLASAVRVVATGSTKPVDVLHMRFAPHEGEEPVIRYCINVCGFGLPGEVVRRVNLGSKRLGGFATFLKATVRGLLAYRPLRTRISWVDADGVAGSWEGRLVTAFVANGAYCGGGMWVGRGGRIDDGFADLVIVPDVATRKLLFATPHLYRGTIERVKEVLSARVSELTVELVESGFQLVECDGEQPGKVPAKIRVMPKALEVRSLL